MVTQLIQRVREAHSWFSQSERLLKPEQIALFFLVGAIVTAQLLPVISAREAMTSSAGVNLFMGLGLGLYAVSPIVATLLIGIGALGAVLLNVPGAALLGVILAGLLVARLGAPRLFLSYTVGAAVYFSVLLLSAQVPNVSVADALVWVIGSAVLGFGLRFAVARGQREQEARHLEAIAAERVWLANELHDGIAHHLTVASLHSQLLDDETQRPTSQKVIQEAVGNALTDLRFIINLSESSAAGIPSKDSLALAVGEALEVIETSGNTVVLRGDPPGEVVPSKVERTLARMVRECATNIVKYAGPGTVYIRLDVGAESVRLEVRSPLSEGPPRVASSTGTGIKSMSERARSLKGDFGAGREGNEWVVFMRLPIPSGDAHLKPTRPSMRA